ncbi:MAG: CBS domain-containing protein, partial [Prevotella sp.]|nr:CBS domain-containing protein [Prevotella sp.]
MIVSICAYLTIIIFEPHSIYGMRLAREGKLLTHHTDNSTLALMKMESVIDRHYLAVDPDMPLGSLVHAMSRSKSNILPVVDAAGSLLGEVNMTKIRHIIFRTELYNHFKVAQLMTPPPAILGLHDEMDIVMKRFDDTDATVLPVLDEENHLVGYVSRTHLYQQYRQLIADFSSE